MDFKKKEQKRCRKKEIKRQSPAQSRSADQCDAHPLIGRLSFTFFSFSFVFNAFFLLCRPSCSNDSKIGGSKCDSFLYFLIFLISAMERNSFYFFSSLVPGFTFFFA